MSLVKPRRFTDVKDDGPLCIWARQQRLQGQRGDVQCWDRGQKGIRAQMLATRTVIPVGQGRCCGPEVCGTGGLVFDEERTSLAGDHHTGLAKGKVPQHIGTVRRCARLAVSLTRHRLLVKKPLGKPTIQYGNLSEPAGTQHPPAPRSALDPTLVIQHDGRTWKGSKALHSFTPATKAVGPGSRRYGTDSLVRRPENQDRSELKRYKNTQPQIKGGGSRLAGAWVSRR